MSLLEYSKVYTPAYLDFIEIFKKHEKSHWIVEEVKLQTDVEQWKHGKLSEDEKNLVKSILRLFTESDKAVASGYYDRLIPVLKNNEVRGMLGSFASREFIHQLSYALLNDTLGFGEEFYYEFLEWAEMKEKYEFMIEETDTSTPDKLALYIAKQVMIEGVSLFASFAMLVNFDRRGLLPGMVDVVRWSSADENCFKGDVEILTEQGWQRFDQLDKTVKVAQFDAESKEISFCEPIRYIEKEYEGNVVSIKDANSDVFIECTENHDLFYYNDVSDTCDKIKAIDFDSTMEGNHFVLPFDLKTGAVSTKALLLPFSKCSKEVTYYKGLVYCVTVPTGNIVVKTNDKICVIGNCHIEGLAAIFKQLVTDYPKIVNDDFKKSIYDCAREVVRLEDAFIDIAFNGKTISDMTAQETKDYIRYVVDGRLTQLGLKKNYNTTVNPLSWVDTLLGSVFGNFFERSIVEYSKDNLKGDYKDGY